MKNIKFPKDVWSIVYQEMAINDLTDKLKEIFKKVFFEGALHTMKIYSSELTMADTVYDWLGENNLKVEMEFFEKTLSSSENDNFDRFAT